MPIEVGCETHALSVRELVAATFERRPEGWEYRLG
jgi:hypothetical protein